MLPWKVAVALIAVLCLGSLFLIVRSIHFNNAHELYFPDDSPAVIMEKSIRKEFPNDELLIGVFAGPDLFSAEFLTALDRVAKQLQQHKLVDRVFTVTNADHIAGTEDGFSVEKLIDPNTLEQTTPASRRERALNDRFAPGLLVSKDGSVLAIAVRPIQLQESRQREAIKHALYQAVNAAGLDKQLVAVAGTVALDSASLLSMLVDSAILIPLTMAIGLGLLIWVVGRPAPVIIGAVAMGVVVLPTIGFLVLLNQPFTLVMAMVPPLLAAYTIATLLHLYAALMRARQAKLPRPARVIRALHDVHKAALFNVLTTGAGMASMALTPIPPIQVFGLVGAAGTALIYLVVFHLVPPLLVKWDTGRWPQRGFKGTQKLAFKFVRFSMRNAGLTIAACVIAIVVAVPLATKVEVETDLIKFFPDNHWLSRSTNFVEENLSGVINIEVVFDGPKRDALKQVETLRELQKFQKWVAVQPHVDRAVSMMDMVEEMNWAFHEEDPKYRTLPANDKLLSQLLLVYDGRDLEELVNREFQRTRITLNLNVHGATAISNVIDNIRAHLNEHPVPGLKADIAGNGRLFADQQELLVIGQIKSFIGAFVLIFLLLLLIFRSPIAAAICLIPNLAPLFFVFVVMGATGIPLDMATSLIAGVVLGITVDDTIHLYHGYQQRLKNGASPTFALARSFEASGRAVLAVTLVLVSQFLLLIGSEFRPTSNFGLLAATGLITGQLLELLLLPALIVFWHKRQKWNQNKALHAALARRQKAS